jgi:hypothetical protein
MGRIGPHPLFSVNVASKGLNWAVSLLFATLAWRSISVAAKGLKAIVGSNRDRVGAGRWTMASREKDRGHRLERSETFEAPFTFVQGKQGKRAMAFEIHEGG